MISEYTSSLKVTKFQFSEERRSLTFDAVSIDGKERHSVMLITTEDVSKLSDQTFRQFQGAGLFL